MGCLVSRRGRGWRYHKESPAQGRAKGICTGTIGCRRRGCGWRMAAAGDQADGLELMTKAGHSPPIRRGPRFTTQIATGTNSILRMISSFSNPQNRTNGRERRESAMDRCSTYRSPSIGSTRLFHLARSTTVVPCPLRSFTSWLSILARALVRICNLGVIDSCNDVHAASQPL